MPGNPHQLTDTTFRALRDQPGDLRVELAGVTGSMTSPRNLRDDHPVGWTRHPRSVGLKEHPSSSRVQAAPPTTSPAPVEPRAPAPAYPAPVHAPLERPDPHHQISRYLIEVHRFDDRVLDTNQPGTYPGTKHAASRFQVLFLYNKNLARSGVSLTPDPHIGNKSHFSGLDARGRASSAVDAVSRRTNPEKWLYSWMCGSWAAWEAGFGACEVQHREGDEGFGSVEAERDSGDQSDLGVD